MLKPTLFDLKPLTKVEYLPEMTLRERWWAFHCANLAVYDALRLMALELKWAGYRRCGISLLWERLRWEWYLQTNGLEPYRLSNSYRSLYARFLMAREEELFGFFETRPLAADKEDDPD